MSSGGTNPKSKLWQMNDSVMLSIGLSLLLSGWSPITHDSCACFFRARMFAKRSLIHVCISKSSSISSHANAHFCGNNRSDPSPLNWEICVFSDLWAKNICLRVWISHQQIHACLLHEIFEHFGFTQIFARWFPHFGEICGNSKVEASVPLSEIYDINSCYMRISKLLL